VSVRNRTKPRRRNDVREDAKTRKKRKYVIPGPNNLSEEFDDDMQLGVDD
jgi:hypothetical protein